MGAIGNVTVVSARFLAALILLTLFAWVWTFRPGLRSRRRWRVAGSAAAALVLTVAAVSDGFNTYYSYLPNVSDVAAAAVQAHPKPLNAVLSRDIVKPPTTGRLSLLTIPDDHSGVGKGPAWVWLPPQYFSQPDRRFPVVYLFHGSPGMPGDWFHGGEAGTIGKRLAQQGLPVIEVAPLMSENWLDDPECVNGAKEQVESHLVNTVIPAVDAALRTENDRAGRIFAGMSAGGYCALNMGLRHRDLAGTILDLSGFTGPTHDGGAKALFGPQNPAAAADQNSPAHYAATMPAGPPMRIWLDSGTADQTIVRQMAAIAPTLQHNGNTVVVHTRPGGHSYSVWRPALAQSLRWALT